MQALYFCVPFREQLLEYYTSNKSVADSEENLMTCLADLFSQVIMSSVSLFSSSFLFSLFIVVIALVQSQLS